MKVKAFRCEWFPDIIYLNFIKDNYIESISYLEWEWESQGCE